MRTGKDFSGKDLSGQDFSGRDLSGANFSNAILIGTNFTNANLFKANLTNTNLTDANLTDADLAGTDLRTTNLQGTILKGARLTDANLSGQNLEGKDLTKVDLVNANLVGTNFTNANLTNAALAGTDLRTTNLQGTILKGARLTDANLSGQNLEGKDLTKVNLIHANLAGTNLTNANLTNADLAGTDLRTINLQGAILTGTRLTEAKNIPPLSAEQQAQLATPAPVASSSLPAPASQPGMQGSSSNPSGNAPSSSGSGISRITLIQALNAAILANHLPTDDDLQAGIDASFAHPQPGAGSLSSVQPSAPTPEEEAHTTTASPAVDMDAFISFIQEVKKLPVEWYLCPISLDVMTDPVMALDGHNYDRTYIEKWFETHNTSPVTNQILPGKALIPNHGKRSEILSLQEEFLRWEKEQLQAATPMTKEEEKEKEDSHAAPVSAGGNNLPAPQAGNHTAREQARRQRRLPSECCIS